MVHIVTVHYETDKWVDLQLSFLKRYLSQSYRVYAFLSGEAAKHKDKFYFACCEPVKSHAIKLNILADIICLVAKPEDVIMFIDGDAFPIAPLDSYIISSLNSYPLIAIKRVEHFGDCQPHPSFCFSTVGFWQSIKGDWSEGFAWVINDGSRWTDVGENLLKILNDNNINWQPIYRSHSISDNKILFGVYGEVVYHHCAGFREPITLIDRLDSSNKFFIHHKWLSFFVDFLLQHISLKNKFRVQYRFGIKKMITTYNKNLSDEIYAYIKVKKEIPDYYAFNKK